MTEPDTRPRHATLAAALAAVQAELPKLTKGSTANTGTYSYRYVDLADVSATILPLLGKHGLAFTAEPTMDEGGRFVLRYTLMHAAGEQRVGLYPLPSSGKPQDIGSHITYARRYALCSVTGIAADEDDDGKAAQSADIKPERHELSWDWAEQEQLREGFEVEIEQADSAAIADIGQRLLAAKRNRTLSPSTYDRLVKAGAARKAALAGGGQA